MMIARPVLQKEEADKIAVVHAPKKFPQVVTASAKDFVAFQSENAGSGAGSFRINRIVADQTGVSELERMSTEKKVEQQALERMKEIQEQAYQEAYQLGLDEGREKAFQESREEFEKKLADFGRLLGAIETLKYELVALNEAHIVKLIYYIGSRIAMDEIQTRPEAIISVLRKSIEAAQTDEKITVRVSKSDYQYIESTKAKSGRENEFLKRLKFEESDDIKTGGAVIETNFGVVDASIEQRLEKLWDALSEKLPRVKDTVRHEGGDSGEGGE